MFPITPHQLIIVLGVGLLISVSCQDEEAFPNHPLFIAAKQVPRIGRSASQGPNQKFLMKASKSVPRIGRGNDDAYTTDETMWESPLKYPNWNDIAHFYEYQPELFASGDLHSIFEQRGDDPSVYQLENTRYKRTIPTRFGFLAK